MRRPTPEPLRFPRGVRLATKAELPRDIATDALARIAQAHITTGYCATDGQAGSFTAYIEANVHADLVWRLVRALATEVLPSVAAPIIGIKDDAPLLGPYTTREAALNAFEPHIEAIQHDGLLEFGLIFQQAGKTEEVFVTSSKYLKIWTSQAVVVRRVLEAHGIPEVSDLQFIDEYPRVSESRLPDGNAAWPLVTNALREAFDALPPPGELVWGR